MQKDADLSMMKSLKVSMAELRRREVKKAPN